MLQKCLKDLNTFGGAQATIFPTLQKNSRLQDLEKRLGQIPYFFQVFQYHGSPEL